jgi:hypothetical protein
MEQPLSVQVAVVALQFLAVHSPVAMVVVATVCFPVQVEMALLILAVGVVDFGQVEVDHLVTVVLEL